MPPTTVCHVRSALPHGLSILHRHRVQISYHAPALTQHSSHLIRCSVSDRGCQLSPDKTPSPACRLVWNRIWAVLSDFFIAVGRHSNLAVAMYAVDSLRQLAMRFLTRDELANYSFQNDFLKPFVVVMRLSKAVEIRELIIRQAGPARLECALYPIQGCISYSLPLHCFAHCHMSTAAVIWMLRLPGRMRLCCHLTCRCQTSRVSDQSACSQVCVTDGACPREECEERLEVHVHGLHHSSHR